MESGLVLGCAALVALAAIGAAAALVRGKSAQLAAMKHERDTAQAAYVAAASDAAAARQQALDSAGRLEDFERLKQEIAQLTQAGVLASAQHLSSKLLDDHKRETSESRKEAEERVRQVNEALLKQVADITNSVSQLHGQLNQKGETLDKVMRALSSPGGAGQIAEIGLGNALKSFGLELNRDFFLQQTTVDEESGKRLRPDAVVFLPSDAVLVIDCKASKFILDIAAAEGTPDEAVAYDNLARTMNQHLKALAEKDYRSAVLSLCRQIGNSGEPGRIISIMYLPNEAALEKLQRADPDFPRKARVAQIIPAGPAGLYCALSLASAEINLMRQVENQQAIAEKTRQLLDQVSTVLGYAAQLGKNIKAAAETFAKLSNSINSRFLPRARAIAKLGIQPAKQLPQGLPSFSVHTGDDSALIEGEAAEIETSSEPRLLVE